MDSRIAQARELRSRYQFREVLALLPDGWDVGVGPSDRAVLHLERGCARFHVDGWNAARPDISAAYHLRHAADASTQRWIVHGYAWLLCRMTDYEAALTLLEGITDAEGVQLGYIQWTRGRCLWLQGDPALGAAVMRRGLDVLQQERHGDAFCAAVELAECLLAQGETMEALSVLSGVEVMLESRRDHWGARYCLAKAQCVVCEDATPLLVKAYALAIHSGEMRLASQATTLLAQRRCLSEDSARTLGELAFDLAVCAMDGRALQAAQAVIRSEGVRHR